MAGFNFGNFFAPRPGAPGALASASTAAGSCGGGGDDDDVSGIVPARAPLPETDTLFGMTTCPYCMRTKGWLAARGVRVAWRDIDADPEADQQAQAISGQEGVPVLVLNGQVVVGFDTDAFEQVIGARR